MFPPPRYHTGKRRTGKHGNEIRVLAGALAHLLDEENVRRRWHMAPRRFTRARQMQPFFSGNQNGERRWPRRTPRTRPLDVRPHVLPRRGPPVAAVRVPRRHQHGEWETRQPRGSNPRGPLRGGPKGQPMIRGEPLEMVYVEAPEGRPMIHRRHPRQAM